LINQQVAHLIKVSLQRLILSMLVRDRFFTLDLCIIEPNTTGGKRHWDNRNPHPIPKIYLISPKKISNDDANKD